MSERTHSSSASPQKSPAAAKNRRFTHLIAGSACVLLLAAVVFQFVRADNATSQEQDSQGPSAAGRASVQQAPQPLGRVNNQAVTYEQVARECVERHGVEVLDSIINRMIIQQECERKGIVVTEAEVRQEVQRIVKNFNLPLDTWYQMLKTERSITPQQYHRDIIWPMLALKKLAGKNVQVTEEDMKKAFERDYGPRVEVRAIVVNDNVRRAGEIWQECQKSPDEFDKLAKKYSEDPNSKPLGGVVPPIRRHAGLKQLEEEAFKLKPGEISSVIQTGENRHVILKCEGFTDPVVTDPKIVWDQLHEALVEEKTQQAVAQVFEDIRKRAQVINYLTNESTLGPRPGQLSPGNIQQTSGQTTGRPSVTPATR
ncbi:MAG: peptidylprolyl isomerase [Planctomycetaceae bacterium]|nr:peptidylprolyl isomerase [Planctomycetaceae bacterium]